MNIFISAESAKLPELSHLVVDALSELAGGAPEQVTLIHYDPRYGPRVQENVASLIGDAIAVVADLTGSPPNVLVELGLARALNKPIVVLAGDPGEIPTSIRQAQIVIILQNASHAHLTSRLTEALGELLHQRSGLGNEDGVNRTPKVFVSYSHADREYLTRLLVHLRPLERAGLLELWSDVRLRGGDRWKEEIRAAIDTSAAAVLLVSADLLASEFIDSDELPPLLAAAEERGMQILPLIVKPSRFLRDSRISRFHALNDPARPLISMSEAEREELYDRLGELLEARVGFGAETAPG